MESACVYEQRTVIHELTQGIQMARQLRLNLNSAESREFLIQKILSSYDKALFVLKSAGQPPASPLIECSLPNSSNSTRSRSSTDFEFDQNLVSKKRKLSMPWEDEVRILDDYELEGNTNDGYSGRKYGQKDTLDAVLPPSCSFTSTPFEFSDDDLQPLHFPDLFDDELLLQGYSPPLICPGTSESNYLTDWGSSSSLDLLTDPVDIYPEFEFNNSFLY